MTSLFAILIAIKFDILKSKLNQSDYLKKTTLDEVNS